MPPSRSGAAGRGIDLIRRVAAATGGRRIIGIARRRYEAVRPVLIRVDILFFDVSTGCRRWVILVGYATIFIGPLVELYTVGVACQRQREGEEQ